ncbi:MAG: DNA cytosine methyltransferase [Methylobacter sp.]
MRYLSLFSGIESATMAWHGLGWNPAAFSEIEPFPCALLAHHYPEIPNLGDVTKITEEQIKNLGPLDLVVFGSPCQDLSIAGERKGLSDENGEKTRSGLFMDAIRIIGWARKHNGCRFALWENVPGAFSSNKGRDFAQVVGAMAGLSDVAVPENGWGTEGAAVGDDGMLEWAVLDAQWFGLAQRRKRVFALVDFGDWASRPPILLEPHSLRGDSPPSRKAGEEITYDVAPCLTSSGRGVERTGDPRGQDPIVAVSVALRGREGGGSAELGNDVAFTLRASSGGGDKPHVLCYGGNNTSGPINVSPALNAHGGTGRLDFESECFAIQAEPFHSTGAGYWQEGFGTLRARAQDSHENVVCVTGNVTHTLTANGFDASEDGTGWVVRRLTPRECERLQGFPDNFTLIPVRGKPAADGPRYKALGNSKAVPVVRYIGERMEMALNYAGVA